MTGPTSRWSVERAHDHAADYDIKWRQLAAAGRSVHGEADFVCRFEPRSVLDAGCGTGRVAIELARRGLDVVGVDLDPAMLQQARAKAPRLTWIGASVDEVAIDRRFDVVVTAGNVMIFVEPGTEHAVIENLSRHLEPGGRLVSGFQLGQGYGVDAYDAQCAAAGLESVDRFATWDRAPWTAASTYAVNVHQRCG